MAYEKIKLGGVLRFWFEELTPEDWFAGGEKLDVRIRERFLELHSTVAASEFWKDRKSGHDYLAEILVLDQFSRQLFRGTARAYAYDGQALTLAQEAIMQNLIVELSPQEKLFLYMPFMHSESKEIHKEALQLYELLGNVDVLKYEQIHKGIIDRFGRYPHRNDVLGRESTQEEQEYLANNQEDFF